MIRKICTEKANNYEYVSFHQGGTLFGLHFSPLLNHIFLGTFSRHFFSLENEILTIMLEGRLQVIQGNEITPQIYLINTETHIVLFLLLIPSCEVTSFLSGLMTKIWRVTTQSPHFDWKNFPHKNGCFSQSVTWHLKMIILYMLSCCSSNTTPWNPPRKKVTPSYCALLIWQWQALY